MKINNKKYFFLRQKKISYFSIKTTEYFPISQAQGNCNIVDLLFHC